MKGLFIIMILASSVAAKIPFWVSAPPQGYENQYFSGRATGATSADADEAAYLNAVKRVEESHNGVKVVSAYTRINENTHFENDRQANSTLDLNEDFSTSGVSGKTLYVTQVETYHYKAVNGGWYSFALVRVPRTDNVRPAPNAFTLGLRSAVIPGWGQVKKYEKGKGFFYFAGTAGLIATSVVCNSKSADSHEQATLAKTRESIEFYNDRSNTQMTISVSTLIGAGALWIGNIVSAVHKSEKVYR